MIIISKRIFVGDVLTPGTKKVERRLKTPSWRGHCSRIRLKVEKSSLKLKKTKKLGSAAKKMVYYELIHHWR